MGVLMDTLGNFVSIFLMPFESLARMKQRWAEQSKMYRFAALVMVMELTVFAIYVSLAAVPNYVSNNNMNEGLFGLNCLPNDSLDCPGRLKGVQALTIITAILAFISVFCVSKDWANGAFWSSLYTLGSSMASFFLWFSFNNRITFGVQQTQLEITDGIMYPLSVAGMVISGVSFLTWTAFEVNFLGEDVTKQIPDTILTILDAANALLPPNNFAQKIRNIRFTKDPSVGVGFV